MPITVAWHNPEKTIIGMTFTGSWTWDDLYRASDETRLLYDTIQHEAHLIMDMQHAPSLPSNALAHVRLLDREHPNQGKVVAVGVNAFIHTMFRVVLKLRPQVTDKILIVGTLAEAYAALNIPFDSTSQP